MGPKLQGSDELASRGRVFAFPATFMGGWSIKLLVGWVALLVLAFVAIVLHGGLEATRRLVTVQIPMVVDFGEGGGWALAGAGDGSEPQSVNS